MALPPQLFRVFETFRDQAKDAIWALSSCLCQQTPAVKINGRTCKFLSTRRLFTDILLLIVQIIKVLGEGGFSFVYLAQDEHSGVRFSTYSFCVFKLDCLATICTEENKMSNGRTRSQRSYEGSRGLSSIQVGYSSFS